MKKILLICEKTYHIELLKSILNANSMIFTDEYYFDICNTIRHLEDNLISEEFLNNMKPLELRCLTIPQNTFFEVVVQNKYQDLHCFDKIISLCDYDNCGKLAFAKYLENHHVLFKNAEILPIMVENSNWKSIFLFVSKNNSVLYPIIQCNGSAK